MTGFPINPPRAQIANSDGTVTSEWYRYFAQIHDAVGSTASATWEDGYLLGSTTPEFPEVTELDAGGASVAVGVVTTTVDRVLQENDCVVLIDATTTDTTLLLCAAAHAPGRQVTIKKIDASANKATIAAQGGELIDAAASIDITTRWQTRTVVSNGAKWFVIGSF